MQEAICLPRPGSADLSLSSENTELQAFFLQQNVLETNVNFPTDDSQLMLERASVTAPKRLPLR